MALNNIAAWNQPATACGAADKPVTACGAADK